MNPAAEEELNDVRVLIEMTLHPFRDDVAQPNMAALLRVVRDRPLVASRAAREWLERRGYA